MSQSEYSVIRVQIGLMLLVSLIFISGIIFLSDNSFEIKSVLWFLFIFYTLVQMVIFFLIGGFKELKKLEANK